MSKRKPENYSEIEASEADDESNKRQAAANAPQSAIKDIISNKTILSPTKDNKKATEGELLLIVGIENPKEEAGLAVDDNVSEKDKEEIERMMRSICETGTVVVRFNTPILKDRFVYGTVKVRCKGAQMDEAEKQEAMEKFNAIYKLKGTTKAPHLDNNRRLSPKEVMKTLAIRIPNVSKGHEMVKAMTPSANNAVWCVTAYDNKQDNFNTQDIKLVFTSFSAAANFMDVCRKEKIYPTVVKSDIDSNPILGMIYAHIKPPRTIEATLSTLVGSGVGSGKVKYTISRDNIVLHSYTVTKPGDLQGGKVLIVVKGNNMVKFSEELRRQAKTTNISGIMISPVNTEKEKEAMQAKRLGASGEVEFHF